MFVIIGVIRSLKSLGGDPSIRLLLIFGIIAAYVGAVVFLRKEMNRRRYVAATAEGIVVNYGLKALSIPWEHVTHAKEMMGYATIYAIDGTARSISGFQSAEDLEDFLEVVQRRLAARTPGTG